MSPILGKPKVRRPLQEERDVPVQPQLLPLPDGGCSVWLAMGFGLEGQDAPGAVSRQRRRERT